MPSSASTVFPLRKGYERHSKSSCRDQIPGCTTEAQQRGEIDQREAGILEKDVDRSHGADLIRTLEAFFTANCSPKEAASLLHVHRNTVLYRLERIAEITGMDLNSSDIRLQLHLALHVRLALSPSRGTRRALRVQAGSLNCYDGPTINLADMSIWHVATRTATAR